MVKNKPPIINIMKIISINGKVFYLLERLYQNLRKFYHRNYSLFDILFLLLYFLEQIFLIYFLFKFSSYVSEIVSIFAIVVITTISIQKTILDSKNKEIKEAYTDLSMSYNILLSEYKGLKNLRNKDR